MYFVFLTILFLILIYFIFAPRFAVWLYRPALFPRKKMKSHTEVPCIVGINGKAVNFSQARGNNLCAWHFQIPDSQFTVLVSHGNYGNIETHCYLIEALLRAGYSVFIYDYSGYGASTGLPDTHTVSHDAQAAYDYLIQNEQLQAENIILYGQSIGASITAHLATVRKARAVIFQSGFSSFRKIITEKMPLLSLYPTWLFPSHNMDTMKNLADIRVPILIMHGQIDDVVPFHHAEILYSSANEPKHLIPFPDCDHKNVTMADPDYFKTTIQKFLQSFSTNLTQENEIDS